MKELLEVGVHFGHQTKKWNPKMKKYIHTDKGGIYIIDLQKTLELLIEAYEYIRGAVSEGAVVLFVGTKKQTQDIIESYAQDCGMPYVKNRWLGGTLTNFETISRRTRRIDEIEEMEKSGIFEKLPKKEVLGIKKEYEKLLFNIGGIRNMRNLPDILYVIDPNKEIIAVREAIKLKIPIVAITDTNCDPDLIDFVIPGNDDAIRSCNLLTSVICDAVKKGKEELVKLEKTPEKEKELEERKKPEEKKPVVKEAAEKKPEEKKAGVKKTGPKKAESKKAEVKKSESKKVESKESEVKKTESKKVESKESEVKKGEKKKPAVKKTKAKKPAEKKPGAKKTSDKKDKSVSKDI
jgi:small subunit ribosomal protein S2